MINKYEDPTYVLHRKINDEKEIINEFLDVVNNEKKMKLAHDLTDIGLFESGEYINNEDYLFLVNEKNEGYFWINENGKTRDFKREDLINVIRISEKRKLSNKKYHIVSSGFLYYSDSIDCIKTNVFVENELILV
ncbi:hypothetical protein EHN65_24925 [Salmonella enterica]|nr:hypothetical protein [Salmonella enterica]EAW1591110.1 hypothetical protein [Salmonella enterica]EBE0820547.1 hypothetical protein [Salmonella enterica]EBF0735401.1 hypothetical protein [Salmonella enterica]EBI4359702.1 hypothetical protein [Salmonella enterica]